MRMGFFLGALVVAFIVLAAPVASAARVTSAFDWGNLTTASDESVEILLRWDSTIGTAGAYRPLASNEELQVGDVIRGLMSVSDIADAGGTKTSIGGATGINDFSVLFQTEIVSISNDGDTNGDGVEDTGETWDTLYNVVFGPSSNFQEADDLGIAGNAMALFYEDPTDNISTAGDDGTGAGYAYDLSTVSDGTFFWALGFTDPTDTNGDGITDEGEYWIAETVLSLDDATGAANNLGSALVALNRIFGVTATGSGENILLEQIETDLDSSAFVDVTGFTSFRATTDSTPNDGNFPWPVADSTDFYFTPIGVPVPAAAWMGFALLGALGLGRRLRRRK